VIRLEDLGWGPFFQQQLNRCNAPEIMPARVTEEMKGAYRVLSETGPLLASVRGRLLHQASASDELPASGDWVLVERLPGESRGIIARLLDRRTKLSRTRPSPSPRSQRTEEQVLAANVDAVFVVGALNRDYNPRRIERYLAVTWESGARPVVVLNKADLRDDVTHLIGETEAIAPGVPVLATSTLTGDGIEAMRAQIAPGETAVFVGSSGVGKSSLLNCLLGDSTQVVRDIRADGKGRHTTTSRQLFLIPGGGVVIDTPGLRELTVWDAEAGLDRAFADVDAFAQECAFRDCRHAGEPGCAVRHAINEGDLPEERFASYRKLERELQFMARRQDKALEITERKRWKQIHKQNRERMKFRGR
jgi:ribosome biogenesis GTPase / thiamine phosphate phosphatase